MAVHCRDGSTTSSTRSDRHGALAIVVVDQAPAFGADPLVVHVAAHRDGATPKCAMVKGVGWQRGDPTSQTDYAADAPALAGHFTYAMFVLCGAN